MKTNKLFFAVAVFVGTFLSGYSYDNRNTKDELSELTLANLDALAQGDMSRRVDCEERRDICSEFIAYPDGFWGEDILLGHGKKAGWL